MEVASPFGSRTRTRVLLELEHRGQSFPRELARLLASPLSVVQKAVRSLERDGLITGRMLGRTRLLELNSRYFAMAALRGFLAELGQAGGGLETAPTGTRRRPRRKGRALGDRSMEETRRARPSGGERSEEVLEKWRVW